MFNKKIVQRIINEYGLKNCRILTDLKVNLGLNGTEYVSFYGDIPQKKLNIKDKVTHFTIVCNINYLDELVILTLQDLHIDSWKSPTLITVKETRKIYLSCNNIVGIETFNFVE